MITLSQLLENAEMYNGKVISKLLFEEIMKKVKKESIGDYMNMFDVVEAGKVEEILDEFFR